MKNLILFLSASLIVASCTQRSDFEKDATETIGVQGICIIHDCPLREKPNNESDFITSLYLGDEFNFLGESRTDLNNTFYQIELVDRTRGWLKKEAALFNVQQAAVIKECTLYQQFESPEKNQAVLQPAEYVAILKQDGEWVKVLSANRQKTGWTKKENLSTEDEDIFIATLAYSDLLDYNGNILRKQLPYFIKSLPDKNATLALHLQKLLEEEVANAIAVSIIEYEMEYLEGEGETID